MKREKQKTKSKKIDIYEFYGDEDYRRSLKYSDYKRCSVDFFRVSDNENANAYASIRKESEKRHFQQIKKLIKSFLSKNQLKINEKNAQGNTLLMDMIENKNDFLGILEEEEEENSLSYFVNKHFSDVFDTKKQRFFVTKALIELKADANIQDVEGRTLLEKTLPKNSLSFMGFNMAIWLLLIQSGAADVNFSNSQGQTALHFICANPALKIMIKEKIIKKLLEEGALAHIKDNENKRPRKLLSGILAENCKAILFIAERRELKLIAILKHTLLPLFFPSALVQLTLGYSFNLPWLKPSFETSTLPSIPHCGSKLFHHAPPRHSHSKKSNHEPLTTNTPLEEGVKYKSEVTYAVLTT